MQTEKELLLIIVAAAFLLYILLSFIVTMYFFQKRKQAVFNTELAMVKTTFEKELLTTQLEIQEETFAHISRELHDHVGHYLSLAKLQLTTIQHRLPVNEQEIVNASMALISNSLEEIRNIAKSLNTENIISNGFIKTVEQQVEEIKKLGHFTIDFTVTGNTCFMSEQQELVLFRIFQEVLNNILRHSQASAINISLDYDSSQLAMRVSDNGIGFETRNLDKFVSQGSSGLKNIIKRSSLIHSAYHFNSAIGEGTTIEIITPYKMVV